MIKAPPEFAKMGVWFDLEIRESVPPGEDVFAFALSHVTQAEQQAIKRFLVEVLEHVRDPKALQAVWRQADSRTIIPDDKQLRWVLAEIIRRIDRHATGAPHRLKPLWPASIKVPSELAKMGMWFDPDILDTYPEVTDAYAFALSHVTKAEQQVIKRFLADVLEKVYDPEALREIWRRSHAHKPFHNDADLRLFLSEIIRRIDLGGVDPGAIDSGA